MRSRRIGIKITPRTLLAFVRQHCQFADGKFPEDMQYAGAYYDFDIDAFCIKLLSASFDQVEEGHTMEYKELKKVR